MCLALGIPNQEVLDVARLNQHANDSSVTFAYSINDVP